MNKQTEALKLALEALNRNDYLGWQTNIHVRQAIREALAEQPAQQQEPVAWITKNGKGWLRWHKPEDSEKNKDSIPLYTSPPASKPWTGLTDEEIARVVSLAGFAPDWAEANIATQIVRVCQDMLKEKNA